MKHTVFVPNGESRRETAILLVGTADEYDIGQRSIRTAPGGFYITEELADALAEDYNDIMEVESEPDEESDEEPDEEPSDSYDPSDYKVEQVKDFVTEHPDLAEDMRSSEAEGKNRPTLVEWLDEFIETSGNRAAKNSTTEEE